jgi:hypothetical protein
LLNSVYANQQAGYQNTAQQQAALAQMFQQNAQFNAAQGNQMSQFNAGQLQQNNQFNATAFNALEQFNAGQGNQLSQFNAGQQNQGTLQQAANQQQVNVLNAQNAADLQKANNDLIAKYTAAGMTLEQAEVLARNQLAQVNLQAMISQEATRLDRGNDSQQNATQAAGTALAAAGTVATALGSAASDRRLKKNIKYNDKEVEQFLSALHAYSFDYKDSKFGQGTHLGIMAQDAEKSALGKSFVEETPEGKMIDGKKALGVMLAGLANINKRIQKLEGKKNG